MKNPCGTTRANVLEKTAVNGIPVYIGTGVNPVNSPAQFFVAWGKGALENGLIHTFNSEKEEEGFLWFVEEEDAENKYYSIQKDLKNGIGTGRTLVGD